LNGSGDGPTVFAHACKMGLEGIVSKRKDSTYRSGHSADWVKMKNSSAYSAQCRQERLRSPSSTPSATVRSMESGLFGKLERRHGAFRTTFSVAACVTLLKHLEKLRAPAIASEPRLTQNFRPFVKG
jgi:bifunctional non-homologous end joining protein LigD